MVDSRAVESPYTALILRIAIMGRPCDFNQAFSFHAYVRDTLIPDGSLVSTVKGTRALREWKGLNRYFRVHDENIVTPYCERVRDMLIAWAATPY